LRCVQLRWRRPRTARRLVVAVPGHDDLRGMFYKLRHSPAAMPRLCPERSHHPPRPVVPQAIWVSGDGRSPGSRLCADLHQVRLVAASRRICRLQLRVQPRPFTSFPFHRPKAAPSTSVVVDRRMPSQSSDTILKASLRVG
jgi:hypothetical protein